MKKVAIIRGGPHRFHEAIPVGQEISARVRERGAEPIDIVVDTKGIWHRDGIEMTQSGALIDIDHVISVGKVLTKDTDHPRELLDRVLGPLPIASVRTMRVSAYNAEPDTLVTRSIWRKMPAPWHVYRSWEPEIARTLPELHALIEQWDRQDDIVVTEMPSHTVAVEVIVLPSFRGQKRYVSLPHVIHGAGVSREISEMVASLALAAAEAANVNHALLDIRINRQGKPFLASLEPDPLIMIGFDIHPALARSGVTREELINHMVTLALENQ